MADLEPITRKEMIISGEDLEPITREEWFLKQYGGGGGSNTVIINGEYITSFEQEVYKCSTPFSDVCKALKDGKIVKLSITNDFAHAFGNIGDYFKFKSMEVDPLSEEIISITFERLYKKSSTTLCNDTIIYSATDTNNEHALIKTEWTSVEKSVTLTAGQTTASFVVPTSEISDLSGSTIDIYTSIWGAEPTDVRISGTNLNIDFDAQQTDMTVKVRIS
jgi:hypothetical protein